MAKILYRLGGIGPDYARLNGDAFADIAACAFTSKSSERKPNIYVSLKYVAIDAPLRRETFKQHLMKVIDHELFHLFSPTASKPWDKDEAGAIRFEKAGAWARR